MLCLTLIDCPTLPFTSSEMCVFNKYHKIIFQCKAYNLFFNWMQLTHGWCTFRCCKRYSDRLCDVDVSDCFDSYTLTTIVAMCVFNFKCLVVSTLNIRTTFINKSNASGLVLNKCYCTLGTTPLYCKQKWMCIKKGCDWILNCVSHNQRLNKK